MPFPFKNKRVQAPDCQMNWEQLSQLFPLGAALLGPDSVGASQIAPDAVGQSEIAALSVGEGELIDGAATARKTQLDAFIVGFNANGAGITPASSGWGNFASTTHATPPVVVRGLVTFAMRMDQEAIADWRYCRSRLTISPAALYHSDPMTLENTFFNPSSPRYSQHICTAFVVLNASTTYTFNLSAHSESAGCHVWRGGTNENYIYGIFWKNP